MLLVEDSRRGKTTEGLVDLAGIEAGVLRYLRHSPPTVGIAADGAVHRTLGWRAYMRSCELRERINHHHRTRICDGTRRPAFGL